MIFSTVITLKTINLKPSEINNKDVRQWTI